MNSDDDGVRMATISGPSLPYILPRSGADGRLAFLRWCRREMLDRLVANVD